MRNLVTYENFSPTEPLEIKDDEENVIPKYTGDIEDPTEVDLEYEFPIGEPKSKISSFDDFSHFD